MRRTTTPSHTFTFPEDFSVVSADEIYISYAQGCNVILEKEKRELSISPEQNSVSFKFTQEETARFLPGEAFVQIKAKTGAGVVLASQIIRFIVKPVIKQEVI